MQPHDVLFNLRYSFHLNTMQATLLARLDKLLSFTLLLLGSAVAASFGWQAALGFIVAALSAIQFVWQPGRASMLAERQAAAYRTLLGQTSQLDTIQLQQSYQQLQQSDPAEIGSLRDPAFKRAVIALDLEDTIALTPWQRIMAWLAGDLPK